MWPMLITSFFLLIFSQLIPFFRPVYSFFFWSHAPLIYVFYLADTSSSYYMHLLYANPYNWKNTITIITKKPRKSRKTFCFYNFFIYNIHVHIPARRSYPQPAYQHQLIHIFIHIFLANFLKIVDFKAFSACKSLWITCEIMQFTRLLHVNKQEFASACNAVFYHFRHFVHERQVFFIWTF